ncbi:hypothetical protein GCM10011506_13340 [Marivirga lumbricoides]|uniref:Uncharacterized protein n=1 Tax=Marivirga lumbricoides TaxID=1046115 RepID=A0ABQ1LUH9_9BACT|nr:hypothetical protein GCM10011506_13340 [Marivirga lumbricoides]
MVKNKLLYWELTIITLSSQLKKLTSKRLLQKLSIVSKWISLADNSEAVFSNNVAAIFFLQRGFVKTISSLVDSLVMLRPSIAINFATNKMIRVIDMMLLAGIFTNVN